MDIPAPTALGAVPTIAISAPFGRIDRAQLEEAAAAGRSIVILHEMGSTEAQQAWGPRELGEESVAALQRLRWDRPWGLGGVCRTTAEVAQFASAGFTWFTLDLTPCLEPRAGSMTLEELDAAIVSLEDRGCYPLEWHEPYLNEVPTLPLRFTDEELARVAVRFGQALAEAEQMQEAMRVSAAGQGALPDLELSFVRAPVASSPEDFVFLCAESVRRGLVQNAAIRVAPAFGAAHEPGVVETAELPPALRRFPELCRAPAVLSVLDAVGRAAGWTGAHWNATERGRLHSLRELAQEKPALFREWLVAAQEAFPTCRADWHVSTADEEVRFLPNVPDAELATTFLDTRQGRQLLLVTWTDVADRLASRIRSTFG